jgi:hypothetical protein
MLFEMPWRSSSMYRAVVLGHNRSSQQQFENTATAVCLPAPANPQNIVKTGLVRFCICHGFVIVHLPYFIVSVSYNCGITVVPQLKEVQKLEVCIAQM